MAMMDYNGIILCYFLSSNVMNSIFNVNFGAKKKNLLENGCSLFINNADFQSGVEFHD